MIQAGVAERAATEARVSGVVYLVEADFKSGIQRWTTWPMDLEWGGHTYKGLGGLGQVGDLSESETGVGGGFDLKLSPVAAGILPLALVDVEGYRGRAVNIYIWPVNQNYVTVGSPVLRKAGTMDTVSIERENDTGSITMKCRPAGISGRRKGQGARLTHAQQQAKYPGDRGLEQLNSLVNNPQLWLSKAFQEI